MRLKQFRAKDMSKPVRLKCFRLKEIFQRTVPQRKISMCRCCRNDGEFRVEWRGIIPYKGRPEVIAYFSSCRSFSHMVDAASRFYVKLGSPDAIVCYRDRTNYMHLKELLISAVKAGQNSDLSSICQDGQHLINLIPQKGQKMLFR
jgi:hypothetical protein